MPVKYKLPNSPKRGSNLIYWLLALILIAGIGWLGWHFFKAFRPSKPVATAKSPAVVVATQPQAHSSRQSLSQSVSTPVASDTNHVITPRVITEPAGQFPRHVQNVFEAQLALIQLGISSGSLDGAIGSQTHAALAAYQKDQGLPVTGELDANTKTNLELAASPYTTYAITTNDLSRLQPIATTWLGKSQQTTLDYENILELVSEKSFSHPNLIRKLNPAINWTNVAAGITVTIPSAAYPDAPAKAAWVTIHLNSKTLEAFDAGTNLIAHFPCSIARRVEKRPIGLLHVEVVAPNPNYTFDPDVFPESDEARQLKRKLILPPGPNNPVGVAWIGLDRPGYGIHGTPRPEDVGRTESHGCFRLANWNAEYLLRLITVGTPVYVVE